jgi:hypothetical protein
MVPASCCEASVAIYQQTRRKALSCPKILDCLYSEDGGKKTSVKRRETVDKRHGVMPEKMWMYKCEVRCNHRLFLFFSFVLLPGKRNRPWYVCRKNTELSFNMF